MLKTLLVIAVWVLALLGIQAMIETPTSRRVRDAQ